MSAAISVLFFFSAFLLGNGIEQLPVPEDNAPTIDMTAEDHKFYVSLTDMRYNDQTQQVEVALKLFIDDFEKALDLEREKKGWHITSNADRNLMLRMSDYLDEHLKVELNQEKCQFEVLGYELEEDVVWVFLESNKMAPPRTVLVQSTVLLDTYGDQQNIIHFEYLDNIRSLFLSRAVTEESIVFN